MANPWHDAINNGINNSLNSPMFTLGSSLMNPGRGTYGAAGAQFSEGVSAAQRKLIALQEMKNREQMTQSQERNLDMQEARLRRQEEQERRKAESLQKYKEDVANVFSEANGPTPDRKAMARLAMEQGNFAIAADWLSEDKPAMKWVEINKADGGKQRGWVVEGTNNFIPVGDVFKEKEGQDMSVKELSTVSNTLRDDWRSDTEGFDTINQQYRIIEGADNTGAGDTARIFSFMKILDPTSVVREGEQATAQNASGIPSAIRSKYNHLIGGGTLDDKARQDLLKQAKKMFEEQREDYGEKFNRYQRMTKQLGIPQELVMPASNPYAQAPQGMVPPNMQGMGANVQAPLSAAEQDELASLRAKHSKRLQSENRIEGGF